MFTSAKHKMLVFYVYLDIFAEKFHVFLFNTMRVDLYST